ncbi:HEPN domain-containing protein [Treponema sp. OMZ 792]|uniref:HEPN domain-containing protein n=1 Tax=unclassified Treponema TaxID=2638727 RepID=UPI0020A40CC0|nr:MULTISPECIES: HEPN domain-containing protein [unclassified Treponema]UTC74515.1 HEPN domain-containing protein [Treponema sp. OMZ 792]UTC80911.1 HEPN domain-containing protein [Treponema sp. OMZ 798]
MNDEAVKEWFDFANMDFDCARHLYENMHPKPLTIICYHCQQASEKFLKGLLISLNEEIQKTHDLLVLARLVKKRIDAPIEILKICAILNPYGVRSRYPQEVYVDDNDTKYAIDSTERLKKWAEVVIETI